MKAKMQIIKLFNWPRKFAGYGGCGGAVGGGGWSRSCRGRRCPPSRRWRARRRRTRGTWRRSSRWTRLPWDPWRSAAQLRSPRARRRRREACGRCWWRADSWAASTRCSDGCPAAPPWTRPCRRRLRTAAPRSATDRAPRTRCEMIIGNSKICWFANTNWNGDENGLFRLASFQLRRMIYHVVQIIKLHLWANQEVYIIKTN